VASGLYSQWTLISTTTFGVNVRPNQNPDHLSGQKNHARLIYEDFSCTCCPCTCTWPHKSPFYALARRTLDVLALNLLWGVGLWQYTRVWKIETELLVGVLLASSLPVAHVDRTAITRQPAGTCIALIWSRLVNSIHPIMGAWEIFMPCGLSKQYHDSMISLQRKTCVATGMCKLGSSTLSTVVPSISAGL
jgi:hypothetical protein